MERLRVVVGVAVVFLGIVCFGLYKKHLFEKSIIDLQNQIAERDKTIEIQKGVNHKLTTQLDDVNDLLNGKDEQVKLLLSELKKRKEEVLTATTFAAKWKAAYEAEVKAHQTEVPGTNPDTKRTKIDFEKDWGYISVKGYTLSDPPEAWIKVQQNRPLKMTLAISQDKEMRWHTYVTSSEENVGIDVVVSGVNPWLLTPKWYERIGLNTNVGLGSNQGGLGALLGLGVDYQIGKFSLGPAMWFGISDRVDRFYGATLSWRPFQRD